MSDNFRVTVSGVPSEMESVASAIGRSMDIDVGGADSFVKGEDGKLVAKTWANEEFANMFQYLFQNPEALHMAIVSDYEKRWQGLTPPSLEDIIQFCSVADMNITSTDIDKH